MLDSIETGSSGCWIGGDELYWTQQTRWNRLDQVHVLSVEAFAKPGCVGAIVGGGLAGKVIDGQVGDFDAQTVLAALEQAGDVDRVGRAPHAAGALVVDVDDGGLAQGRVVHGLLTRANFDVTAYGSSDWSITPRDRHYRNRDAEVLRALLAIIRAESERQPDIDPRRLAGWYRERSAQIECSELGMIVHQLDMVATRRQDLTAFT